MVLVLPVIVEGRVVQVVQQGTAALSARVLDLAVCDSGLHSELGHDTSVLFFTGTLLDLQPWEELSLYLYGLLLLLFRSTYR